MISVFEFILLSLATFRLTRLIVFDKITAFLRDPFINEIDETEEDGRVVTYIEIKETGIKRWIGELFSCYWCAGVWCAVILFSLYHICPMGMEFLVIVLAVSGGAGILESLVNRLIDID